jgi:hypothetical protein
MAHCFGFDVPGRLAIQVNLPEIAHKLRCPGIWGNVLKKRLLPKASQIS